MYAFRFDQFGGGAGVLPAAILDRRRVKIQQPGFG